MNSFTRGVLAWFLAIALLAAFLLMIGSAVLTGMGIVLAITAANPLPLALTVIGLIGLGLFHFLIQGFDWVADRLYL